MDRNFFVPSPFAIDTSEGEVQSFGATLHIVVGEEAFGFSEFVHHPDPGLINSIDAVILTPLDSEVGEDGEARRVFVWFRPRACCEVGRWGLVDDPSIVTGSNEVAYFGFREGQRDRSVCSVDVDPRLDDGSFEHLMIYCYNGYWLEVSPVSAVLERRVA